MSTFSFLLSLSCRAEPASLDIQLRVLASWHLQLIALYHMRNMKCEKANSIAGVPSVHSSSRLWENPLLERFHLSISELLKYGKLPVVGYSICPFQRSRVWEVPCWKSFHLSKCIAFFLSSFSLILSSSMYSFFNSFFLFFLFSFLSFFLFPFIFFFSSVFLSLLSFYNPNEFFSLLHTHPHTHPHTRKSPKQLFCTWR